MNHLTQLLSEGYCVFENCLSSQDLDRVEVSSLNALRQATIEHRENNHSQGSLVLIADYP